jgi:hypothetical protein
MTDKEIFALVVLFLWTAMLGLFCLSALLDRHRRGKRTHNWVKRLYERLHKESDK